MTETQANRMRMLIEDIELYAVEAERSQARLRKAHIAYEEELCVLQKAGAVETPDKVTK